VAVACQHCGSTLDVSRPDVALISRYNEAVAPLTLPLGKRGTLNGVEWEVIGYLERSDGDADWNEYLLFNPYAGYRWLIENGRKWQFGTPLLSRPQVLSETQLFWRDARFTRDYEPVTTETKKVVGEFYWRVTRGDTVDGTTWSNFDTSLSSEWTGDEINWTELKPVRRQDVLGAFGSTPSEPGSPKDGGRFAFSFSKAPLSGPYDLFGMFLLGFMTMFACWLVIVLTAGNSTPTPVTTLALPFDGPAQTATIGTVTVDRPYRFVTVEAWGGGFENKWVDLDYTLVEKTSQTAISGYDTLEYYTGRDSDGYWTEGSTRRYSSFGAVPRGVYDVVVEASAHDWRPGGYFDPPDPSQPPLILSLRAYASGKTGSDLFWVMIAVFGLPGLLLIIRLEQKSGNDD
jgi:hypothetical protein